MYTFHAGILLILLLWRVEKSCDPGDPGLGNALGIWGIFRPIYALIMRSFSGWLRGTFRMTGKELEILTWKFSFLGYIFHFIFYQAVTGEHFLWILRNSMKISLFVSLINWRIFRFRESFWYAVLVWLNRASYLVK